jgi:tetratricopeptide (TPR) repeat protein
MPGPSPRNKRREQHKPGAAGARAAPRGRWAVPPGAWFLLLAFVLYGNTIGHEYALDDGIVVSGNKFTAEGWKGIVPILTHDSFYGFYGDQLPYLPGGRYRPLSIVTFAIEQSFFHGNPHVSHAVNVILYGLTAWLLLILLGRLLGRTASHPPWTSVPALATLLFLVHPLHTEVVANIKGRDEILALLFALGGLLLQLRYLERRSLLWLVSAGGLFFLALLSKESALPFLIVYPLALWFFTSATRGDQMRLSLASIVAVIAYVALRRIATGGPHGLPGQPDILNDPFLHATVAQRLATMSDALLRYLRLLLIPYPLTYDYYFNQVPIVGWSDPGALASLVIHLALVGLALRGARAKDPIAFGTFTYLIGLSVVSNVVVSVGVIMSERFLYMPSIGVAVAAASAFDRGRSRLRALGRVWLPRIAALVLLAFAALTVLRNPAWHDSMTLFERDVRTSSNSAKGHTALAEGLLDVARRTESVSEQRSLRDEAILHLHRAVEIYPGHGWGWLLLGDAYAAEDSAARAIASYRQAIAVRPNLIAAYTNLSAMLRAGGDNTGALETTRTLLQKDPNHADAWYQMGLAFEAAGQPESALVAYDRAVKADSTQVRALTKLGLAYRHARGDAATAAQLIEKAIRQGDREEWVWDSLGTTLMSLGEYPRAASVFVAGLADHPESADMQAKLATAQRRMAEAHPR